jgi:hypothetical protein
MKSNEGTYVTTNTLISISKYDRLIRFDSDDIMKPTMVEVLMNNSLGSYNHVLCDALEFGDEKYAEGKDRIMKNTNGVALYKKEIFNKLGGYMNWKCSSDTELNKRGKFHKVIKSFETNEVLFFRRAHRGSLTNNENSDFKSELRKNARQKIQDMINHNSFPLYVHPHINDYSIIYKSSNFMKVKAAKIKKKCF